jgi:glycosyltransferase involved in cell wall biosynthesis
MPCYNVEATIDEALCSLFQQTLQNFEVIAINDGSTDNTGELLKTWNERDQRLRVITQDHGGIILALNKGLIHCRAPYIARMDADDIAYPERLRKQVAYLDAEPNTAVVSSLVEGFPEGQVREGFRIYIDWLNSLVSDDEIRREIFVESPMVHPSVIFRREWIDRVGGYQERGWPEDYDLWLRMYLKRAQFAKVPEVLLKWREDPERLTRTDSRYSLENFLRAKAYYLARGPLVGCDAVILWGAGMVGRRISKHLLRQDCPLVCFVDIDPKKIGRTRRSLPIVSPDELPEWLVRYDNPRVLAGVGARGARGIIREQLNRLELREGEEWWGVA